jgi:hypothetical protein
VCAWGGGPPGGQLALETDVGRRKNDAWQRQRHVLAALAEGIISGRRPATLRRWGEARRLVCAACSMIYEPIDGGWLMERVGAFPAKIRRHQHYRQIRGGWGVRLWLAHEFRREWKSGRRAALRHTSKVGLASRLAQHKSEVLHYARTQRLLRGPRYPSAIWGPASFIGLCAAERLPEIDMRPYPCQYPPVTGLASPRHGALQMDAASDICLHR